MEPTTRLYLHDDHCTEAAARIVAIDGDRLAFDQTCFYPGGGGQPPDEGVATLDDATAIEIMSVQADTNDVLWHIAKALPAADLVGRRVQLAVDAPRRLVLARYHTVLHVLNTIALRDYDGWITGVQIGTDYSRIDFKIEGFSPALCAELETKVNAVLQGAHRLRSFEIPEEEFRRREDLLRTLEVKPPVRNGHIRVVEIEGFDAQACGGTHVHSTADVGTFSIVKTENKGRVNKRLYVRLG